MRGWGELEANPAHTDKRKKDPFTEHGWLSLPELKQSMNSTP